MDTRDVGCARQTTMCMHAHTKCHPRGYQCVCLVVTTQDFKFEQNPFMDSGDIGCARQICQILPKQILMLLLQVLLLLKLLLFCRDIVHFKIVDRHTHIHSSIYRHDICPNSQDAFCNKQQLLQTLTTEHETPCMQILNYWDPFQHSTSVQTNVIYML